MHHPVIVISGPTCAGKSRLIDRLVAALPQLQRVVTCTTRKPRGGEVNGKAYHFLSRKAFEKGIEKGIFVEYKEVHKTDLYGVRALDIAKTRKEGPAVIILDPPGAKSLAHALPNVHCAFVMAPDEDLRKRLTERSTDQVDFKNRLDDVEIELRTVNSPIFRCIINNVQGETEFEGAFRQLFNFVSEKIS